MQTSFRPWYPATRTILVVVLATLAGGAGTAARKPPVSEASVRAHLEFLASDAMNGRGSGTRDEEIAAAYVAAQFRRLGLKPGGNTDGSYVQTVEIVRTAAAGKPTITIGDLHWTFGKDFVVTSVSGPDLAGPLQRVTSETASVTRGAIAVLPDDNMELAGRIAQAGALAVLVPRKLTEAQWSAQLNRTPSLGARITGIPAASQGRPTIVTLSADAASAIGRVADGTAVRIETPAGESQTTHTFNAVGILPGTDGAEEAILITSHLDHLGRRENAPGDDKIYNGADDDASGTVAVIEMADAFAAHKAPRRTVIFACFGSEEAGGFGATYFRETTPIPLNRIVANVEFEMIGRPDPKVAPHTLWLTGYERSDLGPQLAAHGARLVQDPHPEQNFFRRSDNITLAVRGVVAHTVSSFNLHKEYHTPEDETRLIDYAHMTEAIGSMVDPLWWLANSKFRPEWKPGMKP